MQRWRASWIRSIIDMALVPVVQKLDSANHQINHYQVDRWLGKPITLSTWIDIFPVDLLYDITLEGSQFPGQNTAVRSPKCFYTINKNSLQEMTLHHLEQTFALAGLNLSWVQSIAVIIKSKDPLLVFKVGLEVKFYAPWLSWHLVEQRFWVLCSDFFQCVITAWRAGQFLLKKKKKNLKPLQ